MVEYLRTNNSRFRDGTVMSDPKPSNRDTHLSMGEYARDCAQIHFVARATLNEDGRFPDRLSFGLFKSLPQTQRTGVAGD